MLVLARYSGQRIILNDGHTDVGTIEVVEIRGGQVRLAFDLPDDVKIYREEVLQRIRAEAARNNHP